MIKDVLPTGCAEALAQGGIRDETAKAGGKCRWVCRRNEQTGIFVEDEVLNTADP